MRAIRRLIIDILLLLQIDRIYQALTRLIDDCSSERLASRLGEDRAIVRQGHGSVIIDGPFENFSLGQHSHLKSDTYIHTAGGVSIGRYFHTGRGLTIFSSRHVWRCAETIPYARESELSPVKIGDFVWFGANVTVLPGTTVEDGCVIGADSVLRGHYPRGSVVIGNPAVIVGYRDEKHFEEKLREGAYF